MATVYKTEFGITAFNSNDRLVMLNNSPMVNWGFSLEKLEESLTTLEEIMDVIPVCHRFSLMKLQVSLQNAHQKLQLEHTEMTEEPTAVDFQEYLAAYAAATNATNQED
jgi:aminopeptidase-like protein